MGEQDKNQNNFGDPATEPIDLAQAFKMFNQANREASEPQMAAGEADEPTVSGAGTEGAIGEDKRDNQVDAAASSGELDAGDQDLGGSSDVVEAIDFDARRQDILRGIQRQALDLVRQDFNAQKINTCSIEDLYQRDEQNGRVTFKNPDDPTRDFASRAEAQQWVDAFNKQIQSRFRQEVNRKQQQLMAENAPTLRLISFIPKYEAMSPIEKGILDDLIDSYGVTNNRGEIIGYKCDLDAMAAQAKKIAQRIQPQVYQSQEAAKAGNGKEQVTEPALDMPTGAGKAAEKEEPKSIGEALKMYDKQQREKGKK